MIIGTVRIIELMPCPISFLQGYAPTVFENYTASFEIDTQRVELRLWDTSGKTISIFNVTKHMKESVLPIAGLLGHWLHV